MIKISLVVITLNEERNLERCLRSALRVADEIIVVDSLSTDNTVAIAKKYGARVIEQPFLGYIAQRNFSNTQATYDWVLTMDADEELSPELEQSILAVKQKPEHAAYRFARLNNYCGKWIKHSGWYPDKKVRLADRTKGSWKGHQVHEYWQPNDNATVGDISGRLLHYTYYSISEHIKQTERYSEMAARGAVAAGKDCSLLKIWLGPKWTFISLYIFRLGILDGYAGYLVCKYTAYYTLIKYTKIRQYARWKREGKDF